MGDPLRAVLYPHDPLRMVELVDRLSAGAAAQGWPVVDVAQTWTGLVAVLASGEAEVGIISSLEDLDPLRVPRIIALDELVLPPPGRRRPSIRGPVAPRRRRA